MRRLLLLTFFFLIFAVIIGTFFWFKESRVVQEEIPNREQTAAVPTPTVTSVPLTPPPTSFILPQSRFIGQSFNNCGPASLSMVMSMFGTDIDQETLADRMRPFHNPAGGVDDKSIFAPEFVVYAKEYGFEALERPNGNIELLKKFVANGIPVVVRTWLHPNEDIGHFRIVRGYDDAAKTLLQDDSYEGPNLTFTYDTFLSMWQPFNYGYIIVYPKDKQAVVDAILGEEKNASVAYRNSMVRAERELQACHPEPDEGEARQGRLDSRSQGIPGQARNDSMCAYSHFNLATAEYHLGNYLEAIKYYEQAAPNLPSRMLWYQLEPIQAYQKIGRDDTVFELTSKILNNGNLAYSELYQMRGEIYQKQGDTEAARAEFDKAVYYNRNFQPAKKSLSELASGSN
jgi:tetratricopeptide (TPR) repeat protein